MHAVPGEKQHKVERKEACTQEAQGHATVCLYTRVCQNRWFTALTSFFYSPDIYTPLPLTKPALKSIVNSEVNATGTCTLLTRQVCLVDALNIRFGLFHYSAVQAYG